MNDREASRQRGTAKAGIFKLLFRQAILSILQTALPNVTSNPPPS